MPVGSRNAIKICLVGSSNVGKSCIAERLVRDEFHGQTASTIFARAFIRKELTVNGKSINVNIWDTAGEERYRAMTSLYYRDASAMIFVYDITDEESFHELRKFWVPTVRACTDPSIFLAIAGNKLDLAETDRVVSPEEAQGYADLLEAVFMETSAKTGHNVERLVNELVAKVVESKETSEEETDSEDESDWIVIPHQSGLPSAGPSTKGRPGKKKPSSCKCG